MAMFEMRVTPDGPDGEPAETFDLSVGMRDVVIWERTHRGRALAQIGDNLTAVIIYELAFSACRRQQLIPRELTEQAFTETYDVDVETPDERAARLRAEALRDEIVETPLPDQAGPIVETPDGASPDDSDPTPPGA